MRCAERLEGAGSANTGAKPKKTSPQLLMSASHPAARLHSKRWFVLKQLRIQDALGYKLKFGKNLTC
ncbi:unnamed protein product [Rangifer tarandus platyrhynchus]|uniref:Uncharacterized protein n=1 Tax=Rangifer tarandus platyrhynchus TaxID=3082113 RepID=A0AC59ZCQ4_RANTA